MRGKGRIGLASDRNDGITPAYAGKRSPDMGYNDTY